MQSPQRRSSRAPADHESAHERRLSDLTIPEFVRLMRSVNREVATQDETPVRPLDRVLDKLALLLETEHVQKLLLKKLE